VKQSGVSILLLQSGKVLSALIARRASLYIGAAAIACTPTRYNPSESRSGDLDAKKSTGSLTVHFLFLRWSSFVVTSRSPPTVRITGGVGPGRVHPTLS